MFSDYSEDEVILSLVMMLRGKLEERNSRINTNNTKY
jgi:hypothetical protein